MPWESSDPYYDLLDDFELVVASFQTQYGIRLSRELKEMKRILHAFVRLAAENASWTYRIYSSRG